MKAHVYQPLRTPPAKDRSPNLPPLPNQTTNLMNERENLALYNRVRAVPEEAKKPIDAGRLKGRTDINPLWRIQTLTREFGPAGIGWYTEIVESHIETSGNEKAIYLHLRLYIKQNGEWSKPIEGFGGAMIVAQEKSGLFFDDDAYKKAYTDAISQACRSLGIGADVYWANDATKYQADLSWEEYINSLNSVEELDNMWAQYGAQLKGNKVVIAAFNKRKKALTDGTGAKR